MLLSLLLALACAPDDAPADATTTPAPASPAAEAPSPPAAAVPAADAVADATGDAPPASATAAEAPAAPAPDAARDAVYRALSARDPAPSCESVEALTPTPAETLLYVAENATQPPWAAMRAAECLATRHAAAVQPRLESWVSRSETKGLGLLVVGQLDEMPDAVALAVAKAALAGPEADSLRARILRSEKPEIRALAQP